MSKISIHVSEEANRGFCQVIEQIVDGLVQPLMPEVEAPKAKPRAQNLRILFRGDIREGNRFFYQRGWGDGLALIPPRPAPTSLVQTQGPA